MQHEPLILALEAAIPALLPAGAPEHALGLMLHYASDDPARSDPRFVALIASLRAEADLEAFIGNMQVVANSARRVEYPNLAGWLLERARGVGAQRAIADLDRYLNSDEVPYLYTVAVAGIKLTARCVLGPYLEMVPWDAIPDSHAKHTIFQTYVLGHGFHWPTAVLQRKVTLPKLHAREVDCKIRGTELPHMEVHDGLLCIGLMGPTAPYVLASWLEPPDWAPVFAGGYSMPHLEGIPRSHDWPEAACEQARSVYQAFAKLEEGRKARLRLAMQRLNTAMRRLSPVDAAVDLGIVMEALFLQDMQGERGELTYRLRVRAARYLGSDSADRRRLSELIRKLYTARSIAVHTGRVEDTIGGVATRDLLTQGFSLAASTLVRFIFDGDPDWDDVAFS